MKPIIESRKFPIRFCHVIQCEGFRLPDREYRVTIESAISVVGYAELRQLDPLTALKELGFKHRGEIIKVRDIETQAIFETLGLTDFSRLISLTSRMGKPHSVAFVESIVSTALEDWFRDCQREQIGVVGDLIR